METTAPKITVLMPVRNGEAHLRASIVSILAQTFADFELLILDDGSTDSSPEIIRSFNDPRIRTIVHPQNIGLVPTLNEGLDQARGEFVARQDHDDLSSPERLQKQIDYLAAHPECALVGTEAVQIDNQDRPAFRLLRPDDVESIRWYLCFDNAFIHSSVMFRRAVIREEFGGYPQSFHSEDYALWSSVARVRPVANLAEPLISYREHNTSITRSMSAADTTSFEQATGRIREENLRALFGNAFRPEDVQTLSTYRRDFSAASAAAFLKTFDRLQAASRKASRSLRRIQAIQLAELAYRLLPVSRIKAARLYFRAVQTDPAIVGLLPWLRIAALFVLGDGARRIFLALTGGR